MRAFVTGCWCCSGLAGLVAVPESGPYVPGFPPGNSFVSWSRSLMASLSSQAMQRPPWPPFPPPAPPRGPGTAPQPPSPAGRTRGRRGGGGAARRRRGGRRRGVRRGRGCQSWLILLFQTVVGRRKALGLRPDVLIVGNQHSPGDANIMAPAIGNIQLPGFLYEL